MRSILGDAVCDGSLRTRAALQTPCGAALRTPGDAGDEIGDGFDAFAPVALPFLSSERPQGVDQRRADHDAVGVLRRWRRRFRAFFTPKPTATGRLVCALDARNRRADLRRVRSGRAGDAGDRDIVDKARGIRENGRQTPVVGGRRREADEVQACRKRGQAELRILFRRQIDDDQAIDAGGFGIVEKALDAVDIDGIVIAHQHQRRRVVALAKSADEAEHLLQRHAGVERRAAPPPGSPGRPPSDR